MKPPIAKKIKKEFIEHGNKRIDNYFWLNQRNNPEVINYLNEENEYTDKILEHTKPLQEKLFSEIVSRIKQDDETVPYLDNGFYYYKRYEEGKEYPVYCRKKGNLSAEEEILLNVNEMAEGYEYFQVTGLSVSPDNKILAFGVDETGRRIYEINFKNLITGEILPDKIRTTSGSSTWANDNKTVFYSQKDETLRPNKIFKHILNSDSEDEEVFHEKDNTYTTHVFKTKSKRYLLIGSYSTVSTEFRFVNADYPYEDFQIIQPREKGHEYYVDHAEDYFFIITNWNAKNFRLMISSPGNLSKYNWKELILHKENIFLEAIEVFKNYMVISEREKGLKQLKIINRNDNSEYKINFDEETYITGISTNKEYDTNTFRFYYSSLTTPYSIYDFDMTTKEKKLLKRDEVLGGFDPENYRAERLFATTDDSTKIPISLVYKRGVEKNGNNPLLLYGYGSYGISNDPDFNSVRLSLLDRGFIFAIAHIRGGQELGRQWYEDGKLLKKKNTFTDFIACAEYLIENSYTNSGKLFAMGGSAGGLLMGTIINMRPELFKGIVAAVPFVDIITTMLDESVPLTTGEYDEWGNPNNKDYYDYMLSYSPYDNIEAKKYTAMLVTAGLHDSQVQYWEPAKWVAKLREFKTDDNILLLHTNMAAGHGGASGRFERYKLIALEYAFILDRLNLNE